MSEMSFSDLSKMFSFGQSGSQPMPKNPASYGDWRSYAGNIPNPMNFGSFQNYSGMGRPVQPPSPQAAAVPPTFDQMKERFGQVADQLKQGNLVDAIKTYQYGPKPIAKVEDSAIKIPNTNPENSEDNVMSSSWGG